MPSVVPGAHVRRDQRDALVCAEPVHPVEHLGLGQLGVRVTDRGKQLVLGLGVEVDERHRFCRLHRLGLEQLLDQHAAVWVRVSAK